MFFTRAVMGVVLPATLVCLSGCPVDTTGETTAPDTTGETTTPETTGDDLRHCLPSDPDACEFPSFCEDACAVHVIESACEGGPDCEFTSFPGCESLIACGFALDGEECSKIEGCSWQEDECLPLSDCYAVIEPNVCAETPHCRWREVACFSGCYGIAEKATCDANPSCASIDTSQCRSQNACRDIEDREACASTAGCSLRTRNRPARCQDECENIYEKDACEEKNCIWKDSSDRCTTEEQCASSDEGKDACEAIAGCYYQESTTEEYCGSACGGLEQPQACQDVAGCEWSVSHSCGPDEEKEALFVCQTPW